MPKVKFLHQFIQTDYTHTHMKTLQNITSTGYAGGNEVDFSGGARICYRGASTLWGI